MKTTHDDGDILGNAYKKKAHTTKHLVSKVENFEKTPRVKKPKSTIPVNDPGWVVEVDKLNMEQLSRYRSWKQSVFNNEDISDMIKPYSNYDFSDIHVSLVSDCVKIYLGDLIDNAKKNQIDISESLTPDDIKGALDRINSGPRLLPHVSLFNRRRKLDMSEVTMKVPTGMIFGKKYF